MPPPPLSKQFCLSQKHAVDELSTPSSSRCSSSLAPSGSLITGADCLNTFPPRSSTKWLCVATNANAIEQGIANLLLKNIEYSNHESPRSICVDPYALLLERFVRYLHRWFLVDVVNLAFRVSES